jgi:hypothetical protein
MIWYAVRYCHPKIVRPHRREKQTVPHRWTHFAVSVQFGSSISFNSKLEPSLQYVPANCFCIMWFRVQECCQNSCWRLWGPSLLCKAAEVSSTTVSELNTSFFFFFQWERVFLVWSFFISVIWMYFLLGIVTFWNTRTCRSLLYFLHVSSCRHSARTLFQTVFHRWCFDTISNAMQCVFKYSSRDSALR